MDENPEVQKITQAAEPTERAKHFGLSHTFTITVWCHISLKEVDSSLHSETNMASDICAMGQMETVTGNIQRSITTKL